MMEPIRSEATRRSPIPELAPIPYDVNPEDRRKLVYIINQLDSGRRERDDVNLLRQTYSEILRRYGFHEVEQQR
jgi:hypothetical protein